MNERGELSRCAVCGGRIIAIKDPRFISLTAWIWIHKSATRRAISRHAPVPPGGSDDRE